MQHDEVLEDELSKLGDFVVSIEDFRIDHVIGRGGFGEVHHAVHLSSGTRCAVKRLGIEVLKGAEFKMFIREVKTLVQCKNQFVLPLLGFTDTQPYTIITEFMPRGNLLAALKSRKVKLSPAQLTLIAYGVADGMRALHEKNIIHRDLKSENVLLDENMLPKICDFGVARFKSSPNEVVTKTIGTLNWMAPEVFLCRSYTEKVDVYSYGLLLWNLLTKEVPWHFFDRGQICDLVIREQRRPAFPMDTPKALKALIEKCWRAAPEERPDFNFICGWLRSGKVCYRGTDKNEFEAGLRLIDQLAAKEFVNPLTRKRTGGFDDLGMKLSLSIAPPSLEPQEVVPMPLPVSVPKVERNVARPTIPDTSLLFEVFPDLKEREQPDIPTFQNPQIVRFMLFYLYEDESLISVLVEKGLLGCLDFHFPESFYIVDKVLKQSIDFFRCVDWERMFEDDRISAESVLSVFSLMTDLLVNASDGPFFLLYNHFQYFIDVGLLESLLRILLELRVKDERNRQTIDLILESCLYTDDAMMLDVTIRALATLDDLDFLGSEIISYHLARHNNDGRVFSIAMRRRPDPSLIKYLKPVIDKSNDARLLLLECASTKEGGLALLNETFWINSPDAFQLILTMAQIPECAQIMKERSEIGAKLVEIVQDNPTNEVMEATANILSMCHFSRSMETVVCSREFVIKFIDWMLTVTNTIVFDVALSVVVEMTQVVFVPQVIDITPRIVELWDVLNKEICLKFLALVLVSSRTRQAVVDSGFLETLQTDTSIDANLQPLCASVIALLETPE